MENSTYAMDGAVQLLNIAEAGDHAMARRAVEVTKAYGNTHDDAGESQQMLNVAHAALRYIARVNTGDDLNGMLCFELSSPSSSPVHGIPSSVHGSFFCTCSYPYLMRPTMYQMKLLLRIFSL